MEILTQTDLKSRFGPLFTTFLLGFTTFVLLLWYSFRKQKYWKKLGIPYATPVPFLGSILESFTKPFHEVENIRYKKFGRIFGHYEGNRPLLSVAEPELLRDILVKDFGYFTGRRIFDTGDKIASKMVSIIRGEDWKRIRTIVTPSFTTGKIKRMLNIFQDSSRTVIKNFKEASMKGEPIDAKKLYGAFTMDIIASCAFSTKIDSHNDPDNTFVSNARGVFSRNVSWRIALFTLSPGFMKFFKIGIFPPSFMKFFSNVALQIIKERKRTGQTRNDFLQLLMDSADEAAKEGKLDLKEEDDIVENYGTIESDEVVKSYHSRKTMSHDELVAQCVIFFLAGYDTTATTLSFVSYELALNPDVQEKLIKELDDVLRDNNGKLTYEAVQSMKYLDNVIAETLRKHPLATRLERMADEDYKLGDTGLTIPKGMIVTVPVYAMHRDPKLFPDPEKFDPDRFSQEERANREPYTYLPFGAGPRNCAGMRFALMEMKVCLAHVLSNFRIKTCEKTKVPLDYFMGQQVLQPKNISLFMEVRKDTEYAL